MLSGAEFMRGEFLKMVDEHRATGNDGKDATDFMGAYLYKMKEESGNPDTTFTGMTYCHTCFQIS